MSAPVEQRRRSTDAIFTGKRNWWAPDLYCDHGGYFKVVASLILIHFGLAVDSLRHGPRNSPSFSVLNSAFDERLWIIALLHLLIALMILTGLYWRNHFVLLRFGCGASLLLFNALAVAFAAAATIHNLSYYSAIASVTLSLSSLAALKEPPVQATRR